MSESEVLLHVQLSEVKDAFIVLGQFESQNESFKLRWDQKLQMIALKLLNSSHDPWQEEVFKEKLTRLARVLKSLILGVFRHLRVIVFKQKIFIWEQLIDGIDNIVELLKLTSKGTHELFTSFVTSVDFKKLGLGDRSGTGTLFDKETAHFTFHLSLGFVFCALLTGCLSLQATFLLTNTCHSLISGS